MFIPATNSAILAALLLPVSSAAKKRAARAACINNLKQLGLDMQMYIDDNRCHALLHIARLPGGKYSATGEVPESGLGGMLATAVRYLPPPGIYRMGLDQMFFGGRTGPRPTDRHLEPQWRKQGGGLSTK